MFAQHWGYAKNRKIYSFHSGFYLILSYCFLWKEIVRHKHIIHLSGKVSTCFKVNLTEIEISISFFHAFLVFFCDPVAVVLAACTVANCAIWFAAGNFFQPVLTDVTCDICVSIFLCVCGFAKVIAKDIYRRKTLMNRIKIFSTAKQECIYMKVQYTMDLVQTRF